MFYVICDSQVLSIVKT